MYDIPFVPSSDDSVKTMVKLSDAKRGERAVDLGAGDGKLVVALANAGIDATGIEIDKDRFQLASRDILSRGLDKRAHMVHGSFWSHDLSPYDIIMLYGIPSIMQRLQAKIINEAPKHCRIISNHFTFPDWRPAKAIDNVYLYLPSA